MLSGRGNNPNSLENVRSGDTLVPMTDDVIVRYDLEKFVNSLWPWKKEYPIELRLLEGTPGDTWYARAYSGFPRIEVNNAALLAAGLLENLRYIKVMLVHEVGHLEYYGRMPAANRVIGEEQNEYIADKFVIDKGYGNDLVWALCRSIQNCPDNPLKRLRLTNALRLMGSPA